MYISCRLNGLYILVLVKKISPKFEAVMEYFAGLPYATMGCVLDPCRCPPHGSSIDSNSESESSLPAGSSSTSVTVHPPTPPTNRSRLR
jgi:hypothetical protein